MESSTIVLLIREPAVAITLARALHSANPTWEVRQARNPSEMLEIVARERAAVAICDQDLPERPGTDVLAEVRALSPETVGILLLGSLDPEAVMDSINVAGACRCLLKPFQSLRFLADVAEAITEHRRRAAVQVLVDQMVARNAPRAVG